jgi:predicted Zn-dependent protease
MTRRAPRDPFYASNYALVAEQRGDTEVAIQRWDLVRKKFPGHLTGYVHGAICLRRAGQLEAAEELNKNSVQLFPKDIRTWLEWARAAEFRRDWPEVLRRWEAVSEKFQHVQCDIGVARGLEELGRIEEAEQRLKEVRARAPLIEVIPITLARLANLRGDKEEAVLRWADTRQRFPLLASGYQGGFRQLLEIGRDAEAETLLLAAIGRFPAEAWPTVEYASLAHNRQDWAAAAAAARWAAVRAGWPDRPDGCLRGAEALAGLGQHDEATELRAEHQRRSAS